MPDYVSNRRCNALLRSDPSPSLRPLRQSTKRLPKRRWVGGRLTVTGAELHFDGSESYGNQNVREHFDFKAPLDRIVGIRVRRGPMIARFLAVEIDDGSLLHLRPTSLTETFERLTEAIERSH